MSISVTHSDEQTLHKARDLDEFHQKIRQSMNASTKRLQSQSNLEQAWLPYRRLLKFISRFTHVPSYLLNNYARTIFFLALLGLMFPLNLFITLFTLLLSYVTNLILRKQTTPAVNSNARRILISGGSSTRALQLCRSFYRAGHQIILIDESTNWLTGHRWSNSVERFYVHPSPHREPDAYVNILTNIVRKERIDLFIPMAALVNADIITQLQGSLAKYNCSIFHLDTDHLPVLNNKYTFIDRARSLDLIIPPTFLITSRQQLLAFDFDQTDCSYICKNAISNEDTEEQMVQLPRRTRTETVEYINRLSIDEDSPYLLQKLIVGIEYCTHITCSNGEINLFACSHSSSSKPNYKHVEHPAIFEWCTQYIGGMRLTGHMSFDFIVDGRDGKAYPIGCHPYASSALSLFYNLPQVADAYFANELLSPLVPRSTARLSYWFPHELWYLLRNIRSVKVSIQTLTRIFSGKEAVWAWDDPLPFFLHYHIHFLYLLLDNLFSRHIRFFNGMDCPAGTLA